MQNVVYCNSVWRDCCLLTLYFYNNKKSDMRSVFYILHKVNYTNGRLKKKVKTYVICVSKSCKSCCPNIYYANAVHDH